MITDMHTHLACLSQEDTKKWNQTEMTKAAMHELGIRRAQNIASFFSFGTPKEWEFWHKLTAQIKIQEKGQEQKFWLTSFGIHPWYSNQYDPTDYIEYFKGRDAVGEIGMDSVWCDVPLNIQRRVLEQQLQIAADLNKPVILHTKGQEKAVYELVKDFPGKVCVHWYSGDTETFEKYLEMGCYFTLGPDFGRKYGGLQGKRDEREYAKINCLLNLLADDQEDKASAQLYRHMIQNIPKDRLFLETDGISAVAWAYGTETLPLEDISVVLNENLNCLARAMRCSDSYMKEQLQKNLAEFLSVAAC